MSDNLNASRSNGIAVASLIAGLGGLVLMIVFFATPAGAAFAYVSLALGAVGLVLGILALRRKQSKGLALTGLIAGALSALIIAALLIFALLFVGAFGV